MIFICFSLKAVFAVGLTYAGFNAIAPVGKATSKSVNTILPFIIQLIETGTIASIKELNTLGQDNYKEAKRVIEELYTFPKELLRDAIDTRIEAINKMDKNKNNTEIINKLETERDVLEKLLKEKEEKIQNLITKVEKFLNTAIEAHDRTVNEKARIIQKFLRNRTYKSTSSTWRVVPDAGTSKKAGGKRTGKRTRNVNKYLKNNRYVKTKRINNRNKTKNLKKKMRYMTKKIYNDSITKL